MRIVSVIGFSSFEFGAFEAFFKMVGISRPPGFLVSDKPDGANVAFVNASNIEDVRKIERSPSRPKIVVVGAHNFGTGHPVLPRPIRLTAALALANQLMASSTTNASAPAPSVAQTNPVTSPPVAPRISSDSQIAKEAANTRILSPNTISSLRAAVPPVVPPSALPASQLRAPTVLPKPAPTQFNSASVLSSTTQAPAVSETEEFDLGDDILVVDDSDLALRFMQDHLDAFGFKVHLAKSGEECLMQLSQGSYRCVFLDVMMSGIDGYQTCRMIKQRKYAVGAPPTVIMMTSRSGAIDRVRGALAGCDGYLVKPVDESKLIKALFQNRVATNALTTTKMRSRLTTLAR